MTPEEILRQALAARAERVQVAVDALGSIRARVDRRTRYRRAVTMSLASLSTAAATVVAIVVGTVSCVPTTPPPPPASSKPSETSPTSAAPVPSSTTAAPPTTSAGVPVVNVRVPIYFAADVNGRIRLYREFHSDRAPDTLRGRIEAAVRRMLTRSTGLDPDYRTLWPAGSSLRSVRIDGDVAVVDLSVSRPANLGAEAEAMAVQQLVWTVTAVAADRGVQLRGVRLLVDGRQVSELFGHVAVDGLLVRGSALDTLAPIWLISPQHGDTVARTFTVQLSGAVFEATVQLRVRGSGGQVVQSHTVTLSAGAPQRGDANVSLTLPPGNYVLEAFSYSARDGQVEFLDDHAITVR